VGTKNQWVDFGLCTVFHYSEESTSNRSMIISSQISNGYIKLPPNGTVQLKYDKVSICFSIIHYHY